MPEFTTIQDAFRWWVENEYPKLPTEDKNIVKYAKYDFLKRNLVSREKILEIFEKYADFDLKIDIRGKIK
jgi:hypothetical protein